MGIFAVSEVGDYLAKLLEKYMVPDIIQSADNIGLCSPDEHGDIRLGLFLYDISENEEIVRNGMVNLGLNRQAYPSTYVDLRYMVTAYSTSDIRYRAAEEQKYLENVIQIFRDFSVLPDSFAGDSGRVAPRILLQQMEQNEKFRLWNFPNVPYKLSLFYRVGPVEIASGRFRDVTRVTNVDFTLSEQKVGG